MYRYRDKRYYYTLCDYRKGNKTAIIQKLSWLSNRNIPTYNEDVNNFLIDAKNIAQKNNNQDVLSYIKELTSKMKLNGYDSPDVSINSYSVNSEKECEELLKTNLSNNSYKTAIESIVLYIKQKNNFRVALSTLEQIDAWQGKSTLFTKEDVACDFIEAMFDVIGKYVKPKKEKGILFSKYVSKSWPLFDNNTFIKYLKLCKKYTKNWGINDIESVINSRKDNNKTKSDLTNKNKSINASPIKTEKPITARLNYEYLPYHNQNGLVYNRGGFNLTINKIIKDGKKGSLIGSIDVGECPSYNHLHTLKLKISIKNKTKRIICRRNREKKLSMNFKWPLNNENFDIRGEYTWFNLKEHQLESNFGFSIILYNNKTFKIG